MGDKDSHWMSALELLDAFRKKELSPVEATEAILERVKEVNPVINAIVTLTPDLALNMARSSEDRYMKGTARRLVGVPQRKLPVRDPGGRVLGIREIEGAEVPGPVLRAAAELGECLLGPGGEPEQPRRRRHREQCCRSPPAHAPAPRTARTVTTRAVMGASASVCDLVSAANPRAMPISK